MSEAMQEAAAAVAASMLGAPPQQVEVERVEAAAPEAVEQPAAETAPEVVEEAAPVATFELNPPIPEDIAAELAEADLEEEVEEAVAAYEPETDEWGNEVEVDQDAIRDAIKLRKRNEYLEKRLIQSESGKWKKDAEKAFPLAKHALDDIAAKATSRRGFLKAAKAEHDRILPHVQAYLGEAKVVVDEEKAAATADARTEVAEAWGEPLSNPDGSLTAPQVEQQQRVSKAREKVREGKGSLAGVFAEMLRSGGGR